MIAVDASALIAIVFAEPEADHLLSVIQDNSCVVGVPTLLETTIVIDGSAMRDARDALADLLASLNLTKVPFDAVHALLAREAYARYGKGSGHPARLNFGDCMTYAVAKRDDLPLLFKGDDFVHTDLRPALAPP